MKFDFEKISPALNRLTKAQKKIIAISALALLALNIFWFMVYLPQSRKLTNLKKQLSSAESEIESIRSIAKDRELGVVVGELKTNLSQLKSKFPLDDDALIYQLSDSAKKAGIDVGNVDPQDKNQVATVAGLTIYELPVTLELSCDYRTLGEYMSYLQNGFMYLVKIKDVSIIGQGRGNPKLNITMHILTYLAKQS